MKHEKIGTGLCLNMFRVIYVPKTLLLISQVGNSCNALIGHSLLEDPARHDQFPTGKSEGTILFETGCQDARTRQGRLDDDL